MLRIIYDFNRSARFNMAADLHAVSCCSEVPGIVVRFYSWAPAAISLGYMQNPASVLDMEELARAHVEWIRRPTGGRAVLHKGDLTYSCIFSQGLALMGGTIAQSYALISACLRNGLSSLGIATQAHDSDIDSGEVRRDIKLPCFVAPNRDEIMIDGRKIIGSAQKRSERAVLQHGSLPITTECYDLPSFLRIPETDKQRHRDLLRRKSIALDEIRPGLDRPTVAQHLARGFCEELGMSPRGEPRWSAREEMTILSFAGSPDFAARWRGTRIS